MNVKWTWRKGLLLAFLLAVGAGWLLLWPAALSSQTVDHDAILEKFTRSQLEAAIQQTKNDALRLEGLHQLVRMAGPRLYEGSVIFVDADPAIFQLRGEAAKAVGACRDMATIEKAFDSPYPSLRLWAVLSFEIRFGRTEAWQPLVPKLMKMLDDPDAEIRAHTVEKLWFYPEGPRAIADHTSLETDPDVLLRVARSGSSPDFYRFLVRLLSSDDTKVREGALSFIYLNLWNKATAPMWKLGFNQDVYDRVLVLSRSSSQGERDYALKALSQLDLLKHVVAH